MDARCAGEQDRKQLGGAVDREPADKVHRQSALGKHPEHRAEQGHIVDQQQDAGDRKGEAKGEGEDRHLRIVAEQKCCKHAQPVLFLPTEQRITQGLFARARHPGIREIARHQRVEPVAVSCDQDIADGGPRDHHEQGNPDIELDRPHRPAPASGKEAAEPAGKAGLGAIDQKIGTQREPLEIVDQAGVERVFPGDRQAGQQRPVQGRQRQHILVGQASGLALFHPVDDRFQPDPVRFPFQTEAVAAQHRRAQDLLAAHRLPRRLIVR